MFVKNVRQELACVGRSTKRQLQVAASFQQQAAGVKGHVNPRAMHVCQEEWGERRVYIFKVGHVQGKMGVRACALGLRALLLMGT